MVHINIAVVSLLLLVFANGDAQQVSNQPVILCSIDVTSSARQHGTNFTVEDLDPNLCTHIIYNKASMDRENHDIKPRDPSIDFYDKGGLGLYNKTMKLKEANPELKIILHICCTSPAFWDNSTISTEMIISKFTKNAVKYLQLYGFDGLFFDLTSHVEMEMIHSLREEFNRHNLLLVTITHPRNVPVFKAVDYTKDLSEEFDFLIVGEHWSIDPHETRIFSNTTELRRVISHYKEIGMSSERLVVGIPTFAVTYRLCNESSTGLSADICDEGDEGREYADALLTYSEINYKLKNASEGWVVQRDDETGLFYGHSNSNLWMSFEDPVSARAKAQYVLEENLAGVAIMYLDMDDIDGHNEEGIKLPLTRAIHDALRGS